MVRNLLLILALLSSTIAAAVPASNLKLNYDASTHMLHIEADHPTDRMDRYFIRKVNVTKNGKEGQVFYFQRQSRQDKFIADVSFQAAGGDQLLIELFSSEGGAAQATLTIEQPKEGAKDDKKTIPNGK